MEKTIVAENFLNFDGSDLPDPNGTFPAMTRYGGAPNLPTTRSRIESLTCPSDFKSQASNLVTNHNYVVNYGNTSMYQNTLNGVAFGGAPFRAYAPVTGDCNNNDHPGAAGNDQTPPDQCTWGKPVKLSEILDGTNSTFLVGEVIQGQRNDLRGFAWWGGSSGFTTWMSPNTSEQDVITGGTCLSLQNDNPPCTPNCTAAKPRMMASRSRHPGGVQIGFTDGHVVFVRNTISMTIWRALSTSRAGETYQPQN
jgi:prepilin-type processing-associated H-X9-DG protein